MQKVLAPSSAVDADSLKQAMRCLPGSISVITAGVGDDRTGATVTTASAFSMEPPTMLISINRSSSTWRAIRQYGHFCINILYREGEKIADRFAGKGGVKGPERYAEAQWDTLITGASALRGALAAIDCEVEEVIERHSHALILGQVAAIAIGSGDALLYGRGRYGSFVA